MIVLEPIGRLIKFDQVCLKLFERSVFVQAISSIQKLTIQRPSRTYFCCIEWDNCKSL